MIVPDSIFLRTLDRYAAKHSIRHPSNREKPSALSYWSGIPLGAVAARGSVDAGRLVLLTAVLGLYLASGLSCGAGPGPASDFTGRTIETVDNVEYAPLFRRDAGTLDPAAVARECWKGYLTEQPDKWGTGPSFEPTLRFHFDNRALPWPSLKHHAVDGFDNNARNVGAHALLHEMFGPEKDNDPAEAGEIAYLLDCTDPVTGLAYSPDKLPRQCPLAEGEMARNVMLLYEKTADPKLMEWTVRILRTLREHATLYTRPGIGDMAAYHEGGEGGQGGFTIGEPPPSSVPDPTLDGWQFVYVGWNARAFCEYYRLTHDSDALRFAVALENRLCNSEYTDGEDGSFRRDGSFGGKLKGGSFHMHGHTHCLPGLVEIGGALIESGRRADGLRFIAQASSSMDWLYDSSRNPDAGSMTGWLGEFLNVAAGWPRKADCEGCTMGDVTQTACSLAAISGADPRLHDLDRFYDRAEQIYSSQVVGQMFQLTPGYLSALRACLTSRVDRDLPSEPPEARQKEVERRFAESCAIAKRMVGQQLGLCGFPDWVNTLPSDLDSSLPGIHMQGCCADATIRASHAIWSQTVTGNSGEARVNLAFNRDSNLLRVISCLPYRGEIDVVVKEARRILIRVPEWASHSRVRAFVDKTPIPLQWDGNYAVFAGLKEGQLLTALYPLRVAKIKELVQGTLFTEKWRGNTIVDITPSGKWVPMFQRPQLDNELVPELPASVALQ